MNDSLERILSCGNYSSVYCLPHLPGPVQARRLLNLDFKATTENEDNRLLPLFPSLNVAGIQESPSPVGLRRAGENGCEPWTPAGESAIATIIQADGTPNTR